MGKIAGGLFCWTAKNKRQDFGLVNSPLGGSRATFVTSLLAGNESGEERDDGDEMGFFSFLLSPIEAEGVRRLFLLFYTFWLESVFPQPTLLFSGGQGMKTTKGGTGHGSGGWLRTQERIPLSWRWGWMC
jgi:hypothetical protein